MRWPMNSFILGAECLKIILLYFQAHLVDFKRFLIISFEKEMLYSIINRGV